MYVSGGLGVTVFFFISGFLISRLLLAEECEKGKLDIPAFFYSPLHQVAATLGTDVRCHGADFVFSPSGEIHMGLCFL